MANRKPLILNQGKYEEIKSPDLIDPSVLPTSSGGGALPLKVPTGTVLAVADNTQPQYGSQIYIEGTGQIAISGTGCLQWRT